MYLVVRDGNISNISFMTDGCGATITCASFVTRTAKGKSLEEALRIQPRFYAIHVLTTQRYLTISMN